MPFLIALALSSVLHVAAITLPGWDLPGLSDPEPPALEARLAPPPHASRVEALVPVSAEKPKVPRTSLQRKVASVPLLTNAETLVPVSAGTMAGDVVQNAQLAAPVANAEAPAVQVLSFTPPFARKGRVRYRVSYGDGGFVVGETVQEWTIADNRYSLRSVAEPKGLAALRGKTRRQESVGEVTAEGLRPNAFHDQREGRAEEAADFDWAGQRVVFSGGRGESPLAAGAQDLLSVFFQLAWLAPRRNVDIAVVTSGRIGRSSFEWLGEENVELPGGLVATLHLRTRSGPESTEVWLATAQGGLPVKIRHIDRKGDIFDQVADQLELN